MTERDRTGAYNPFEDTGDWPFRESAPPPAPPPGQPDAPFDLEQHELDPDPDHPSVLPGVPHRVVRPHQFDIGIEVAAGTFEIGTLAIGGRLSAIFERPHNVASPVISQGAPNDG